MKCVDEDEAELIMNDLHKGACGGDLNWRGTTYKILRVGYYWPSLFSDVYKNIRACEACQKFEGMQKLQSLPLKPISEIEPFAQWGLDFIGVINPNSSGQHKYILTATDYFTKWIEAAPTQNATDKVMINFLLENIFSRFGCPRKIITDNAVAFKSELMKFFCKDYNVVLAHSTPYYPQGNGLAESSNKILVRILTKLLEKNKKAWDSNLKYALWADRISTKKYIETSPF